MLEIEEEFDIGILGVAPPRDDPGREAQRDPALGHWPASVGTDAEQLETDDEASPAADTVPVDPVEAEGGYAAVAVEPHRTQAHRDTNDIRQDTNDTRQETNDTPRPVDRDAASVRAHDFAHEPPPAHPTPRPPRARLVRVRLPHSRRSRLAIRVVRPRTLERALSPAPRDPAQDTEASAADASATEAETDSEAQRLSALHPALCSAGAAFGLDVAGRIERECRENVSTGDPLPASMRDVFPELDELHAALSYANTLRERVGVEPLRPSRSTRIKMIRQIARARQDMYLWAYASLLLPHAPSGAPEEAEAEDALGEIVLTPGSLAGLGKTLPKAFPRDKAAIKAFLPHAMGERTGRVVWENGVGRVVGAEGGFRGKVEQGDVHVFVDHSNILYGLLTHLYSSHSESLPPRHLRTLSLPVLSLLLRRGRPTPPGTLHLVASSPLKQDLDPAVRLGFEVSVLKRVEVFADEVHDPTAMHLQPKPIPHHAGPSARPSARGAAHPPVGLRRYKEQGVDEILHLKILQALNAGEAGTIVLATGDARGGQFNRDGFVGAVREALKRGWKVELWSWSEGLSRGWREAARRERWDAGFAIHLLDEWAEALVEVARET